MKVEHLEARYFSKELVETKTELKSKLILQLIDVKLGKFANVLTRTTL